jgi:hypothetical protein
VHWSYVITFVAGFASSGALTYWLHRHKITALVAKLESHLDWADNRIHREVELILQDLRSKF